MKILLIVCCSLFVVHGYAQNVAIAPLLSRPEHEFNAVAGCPTNWPVIVDRIGSATNSPYARRTILSDQQLTTLYEQIGPAFTNWHQTAWANYVATNSAAMNTRRLQLLTQREAILSRLDNLSNTVDFTLAAPLVASNLFRLQQIEARLNLQ